MQFDSRIKIVVAVVAASLLVAVPVAIAWGGSGDASDITAAQPWWRWDTASTDESGEGGEPGAGLWRETLLDRYEEFAEGLADRFESAGIDYEVRMLPLILWDLTDDAARDVLVEYLEESGLPLFGGGFPSGFPFGDRPHSERFGDEWDLDGRWEPRFELPSELREELTARADELARFLDKHGIAYEIEEVPLGFRWVIPDLSDPRLRDALSEFAAEHGGPIFGGLFEGSLDLGDLEFGENLPEGRDGCPFGPPRARGLLGELLRELLGN